MTNSELSEFLNKVLVYYRDIKTYEHPFIVFDKIEKSDFTDYAIMNIIIDKLLKDKYLLNAPYDSYENEYCISGDGIIFINNGGYDVENTNEAKSKIIEIAPKSTIKHSTHDPNLWSVKSYELFKYLFENYYSGKNTELMNIWFFIKSDIGKDYLPKPPKALYLKMILDTYNIKITNFDRPTNWFEKHLPIFKGHLTLFEQNS